MAIKEYVEAKRAMKRSKPRDSKLEEGYYPWTCPKCGNNNFSVEYVRNKAYGRLRRISCPCGAYTFTGEQILQPWHK